MFNYRSGLPHRTGSGERPSIEPLGNPSGHNGSMTRNAVNHRLHGPQHLSALPRMDGQNTPFEMPFPRIRDSGYSLGRFPARKLHPLSSSLEKYLTSLVRLRDHGKKLLPRCLQEKYIMRTRMDLCMDLRGERDHTLRVCGLGFQKVRGWHMIFGKLATVSAEAERFPFRI